VEKKETPLSKVMVPMPKVTPIIVKQESEAAFEAQIVAASSLPVGNYCITENNTYMGLRHGRINHVFDLSGVHYLPHPEPNIRISMKWQAAAAGAQVIMPKKTSNKRKRVKGSSRSRDQTSE
jgi:hypothetical protein